MKKNSTSLLVRSAAGLAVAALALSACGASDEASLDSVVDASGSDDIVSGSTATADSSEPADSTGAAQGLQQNQPVTVTGDGLLEFADSGDDPAVGTAAPVVEGRNFDGSAITIGAQTDAPTMVVFVAHWCPHCNREVPVLVGMENDGLIPDDVNVVGVSTAVADDRDNFPPSEWIEGEDWPWPVMADDEDLAAFTALGGGGFPFTAVLDTDGTVLARRSGEASAQDTVAFLDDALARAAA